MHRQDSIYPRAHRTSIEPKLRHDLPLDLDDRDAFEIGRVKPIVGLDIDLIKVEGEALTSKLDQRRASLVAQMAVRARVEPQLR